MERRDPSDRVAVRRTEAEVTEILRSFYVKLTEIIDMSVEQLPIATKKTVREAYDFVVADLAKGVCPSQDEQMFIDRAFEFHWSKHYASRVPRS